MAADLVWVALFERDDDLAAGPFDSIDEAEEYSDGFDDVYAAQMEWAWFERRDAEIKAGDV